MANLANPLLYNNTFRAAKHDVYDDGAVVKWCGYPVEITPTAVGQNMYATIYESYWRI